MQKFKILFAFLLIAVRLTAQPGYTLLQPDQVFDGETMHTGWVVLVHNDTIVSVGPKNININQETTVVKLIGQTLLPGLIEGHSHLFLHPYNETSWDDQVLKESRAERTARAVTHAKATLLAGFTTVRDLGTEGAMYDDVGLKKAIEKGIVPGPRMIVATRAIVATGTYGPKFGNTDVETVTGAEEVSGMESIGNAVRSQIGKGADLVKVYADYRYGISREARPTFTMEEIKLVVTIAAAGGRKVAAHSSTSEGMKNAVMAGVATIEHGDDGTPEVFRLMQQRGVALCPTLAAGEAIEQYRGWKKSSGVATPARVINKHKTFQQALQAGVTICMGGDVGVFSHGDNAREMELMVEYGMKPIDVLRSATSVNADVFGYAATIGRIKTGLLADLIAVDGDPSADIKNIRKIKLVMKGGEVVRKENL